MKNVTQATSENVVAIELSEAALEDVLGGEMRAVREACVNGHDGGSLDVAQAGSDYANAAY